jgi:hypothetical protein
MRDVQVPSPDHAEFDQICARVDDWEPLPDPRTAPAQEGVESLESEEVNPLDKLILAGLVAPY